MLKKTIYTRQLGNMVASGAKGSGGIYHVMPSLGKWIVVAKGNVRPTKAFGTRKDAVTFAKEVAFLKTGEVIVHSADGKILHRIAC